MEPRIRIEAGARSALDPNTTCCVTPLIAEESPEWSFSVGGIRTITPERTLWEKLLILHGLYCGYRDEQRLPTDRDRISRHYYDCSMILKTESGRNALSDFELLSAVREHDLIAFRQAWKGFEVAVPGTLRFVPQSDLLNQYSPPGGSMKRSTGSSWTYQCNHSFHRFLHGFICTISRLWIDVGAYSGQISPCKSVASKTNRLTKPVAVVTRRYTSAVFKRA